MKALSVAKAISASRDSTLKVWDLETAQCDFTLEGHTSSIRSIVVRDDTVVSASYDFDARIWSLDKKECLHVLKGHTGQVYSVAFDGHRIATGSIDKTVRLWDPVSGYAILWSIHREY